MNKIIKIAIILIVFQLVFVFININSCKAKVIDDPDAYDPAKQSSTLLSTDDDTAFNNKVNVIFTVIRDIGVVVSVGTLIVIGIKFMLGSIEEKAEYKKMMVPYLIGAFLLFAATTIPSLIFSIVNS